MHLKFKSPSISLRPLRLVFMVWGRGTVPLCPDPIQRLAIKGFRDWGSRLSSGGSFRSSGQGRSGSSLEFDWIFFPISISPEVRCTKLVNHGPLNLWLYAKMMSVIGICTGHTERLLFCLFLEQKVVCLLLQHYYWVTSSLVFLLTINHNRPRHFFDP